VLQRAPKIELRINLKAAIALGVTVPLTLFVVRRGSRESGSRRSLSSGRALRGPGGLNPRCALLTTAFYAPQDECRWRKISLAGSM